VNVIAADAAVPSDTLGSRCSQTGSAEIVGTPDDQIQAGSNRVRNEVHRLKLLGNGGAVRLEVKLCAERTATNNSGRGVELGAQTEYGEDGQNADAW
jgi:hypothetical protein